MPLKIIVQNTTDGKNESSNATVSDDVLEFVAKRRGWFEEVEDPDFETNRAPLLKAYQEAKPGEEKAAAAKALKKYDAETLRTMPNPVTFDRFMVEAYLSDMIDEASKMQEEADLQEIEEMKAQKELQRKQNTAINFQIQKPQ